MIDSKTVMSGLSDSPDRLSEKAILKAILVEVLSLLIGLSLLFYTPLWLSSCLFIFILACGLVFGVKAAYRWVFFDLRNQINKLAARPSKKKWQKLARVGLWVLALPFALLFAVVVAIIISPGVMSYLCLEAPISVATWLIGFLQQTYAEHANILQKIFSLSFLSEELNIEKPDCLHNEHFYPPPPYTRTYNNSAHNPLPPHPYPSAPIWEEVKDTDSASFIPGRVQTSSLSYQ